MTSLRDVGPPPVHRWPPQACRGVSDPDMFFPSKTGTGPGSQGRAKAFCAVCSARTQCRDYAMPITDLHGIWGEMNQSERERARKQQKEEA